MVKQKDTKPDNKFYGLIAVLLIIAIIFAYLYLQEYSSYSALKANYASVQSNLSIKEGQLNKSDSNYTALTGIYSSLYKMYNISEYNLTHTYNSALFTSYSVSLAKVTIGNFSYNSTSGIYYYNDSWGRFNYSFYAPYAGYVLFNSTSTLQNINQTCAWQVWMGNKKPYDRNVSPKYTGDNNGFVYEYAYRYSGTDRLFLDYAYTPWTTLCPVQQKNYIIPVGSGENYLFIDNDNSSQGITVTFSAKYIGFHTS